jgi:hypothetical protein
LVDECEVRHRLMCGKINYYKKFSRILVSYLDQASYRGFWHIHLSRCLAHLALLWREWILNGFFQQMFPNWLYCDVNQIRIEQEDATPLESIL